MRKKSLDRGKGEQEAIEEQLGVEGRSERLKSSQQSEGEQPRTKTDWEEHYRKKLLKHHRPEKVYLLEEERTPEQDRALEEIGTWAEEQLGITGNNDELGHPRSHVFADYIFDIHPDGTVEHPGGSFDVGHWVENIVVNERHSSEQDSDRQQITRLPKIHKINGDLDISFTRIRELPEGIEISGKVIIDDTSDKNREFAESLRQKGYDVLDWDEWQDDLAESLRRDKEMGLS